MSSYFISLSFNFQYKMFVSDNKCVEKHYIVILIVNACRNRSQDRDIFCADVHLLK